jgi:hypothetical protein
VNPQFNRDFFGSRIRPNQHFESVEQRIAPENRRFAWLTGRKSSENKRQKNEKDRFFEINKLIHRFIF